MQRPNALQRKRLGAYYTPRAVGAILAEWAIRSPGDLVLEPSFGGCDFLEACQERLGELGSANSLSQLFGCDIDPAAVRFLGSRLGLVSISNRFLLGDFLSIVPSNFSSAKFDVVIGNPPYISNHNVDSDQKDAMRALIADHALKLPATASLWAYFLLHSLSFLAQGGRLAFVLPLSLLNADYSRNLRDYLKGSFSRLFVVLIKSRLFQSEGTDEISVILLADGYGRGPAPSINIGEVGSLEDLRGRLLSYQSDPPCEVRCLSESWSYSLLAEAVVGAIGHFMSKVHCVRLSDIAQIKIGLVTGANKFFVLSKASAEMHGLYPVSVEPVLAKIPKWQGLWFRTADQARLVRENTPCFLLSTYGKGMVTRRSPIRQYLASMPRATRKANVTFGKRAPWYSVDDGYIPDAFLSYMHHDNPRLTINSAGINCLNSIHRLKFKHLNSAQQTLVAVSLQTTLSQLSAELAGRTYGGGVLKHEPREAGQILLAMPQGLEECDLFDTAKTIDKLLRVGQRHEAREAADNLILNFCKDREDEKQLAILKDALLHARQRRRLRS